MSCPFPLNIFPDAVARPGKKFFYRIEKPFIDMKNPVDEIVLKNVR